MTSISRLSYRCRTGILASILAVAATLVSGVRAVEPVLLAEPGPPLAGTSPLTLSGDIASNLVAGADRFLDSQIAGSVAGRARYSAAAAGVEAGRRDRAVAGQRARLATILGALEVRVAGTRFEPAGTLAQPSLIATSAVLRVDAVRWAAFGEVKGEGLLAQPASGTPVADVIAVPDADLTPEQFLGIEAGVAPESQFARRLAESGCRVLVPCLIDRKVGQPKVDWDPNLGKNLHNREFLHRAAFELGRTLAGYELLKLQAAADALRADGVQRPLGIFGWGEGGRLALYAAAIDGRFEAAGVSGYFDARERVWEEPLDHNVFGLLDQFGDAEIAALVAPRTLVIEAARAPERVFPSDGGAPGRLTTPDLVSVRAEVERAQAILRARSLESRLSLTSAGDDGRGAFGSEPALTAFWSGLHAGRSLAPMGGTASAAFRLLGGSTDVRGRADRQRRELDRHTQAILADSAAARRAFLKDLDVSSPEAFARSQARYRNVFDEEVIGRFDLPLLPTNARSRLAYDTPAWSGYEVVLDVHPDVIAYGLLLLPKDLRPGERRPVVVCQHGLEGRPQQVIGKDGEEYYSAFAARLAERGFITFAPQNLYLFKDRFRVLQRKANPLGKTLFSLIVPQHRQIVGWLKSQPFVDPERIAFYGLSYGGKTAMRVPALVTDYCLSICSADFNEWVWKNASTRSSHSYVWYGEYEIFEWDLGHTFNYAEMAALIAPRPFMVERGHFDGVAPDEAVAYEFAKVRHLYAADLKRPPEDCRIEWFVGPHKINGVGTYEFLHQHLKWPERR